jgi:nucleoside-diphosphate-sugar epimerase
MKTILITGAAGFIGARTSEMLLKKKKTVIGIDNLNNYYDIKLKKYRLKLLQKYSNFTFFKADIENINVLRNIIISHRPQAIVNLAARAGVRYSIENPYVYMSTNAVGTLNLLELCKEFQINKFVLASTSSLYAGEKMPFKETLSVNRPISPYAASKKAAEALCYTYNYLYGIDVSIPRYFTVFGPAGRPDMSVYKFIKLIDQNKPIEIYGDTSQKRDFTFVDDIAEGTCLALKKVGFEIFNLGGNKPYKLSELICIIEKHLRKKAKIIYLPANKADMRSTWANIEKANRILNWKPRIDLDSGIAQAVDWYKGYRKKQ